MNTTVIRGVDIGDKVIVCEIEWGCVVAKDRDLERTFHRVDGSKAERRGDRVRVYGAFIAF